MHLVQTMHLKCGHNWSKYHIHFTPLSTRARTSTARNSVELKPLLLRLHPIALYKAYSRYKI